MLNTVIAKHGLTVEKTIYTGSVSKVYRVADPNGQKYVLKINEIDSSCIEREKKFYSVLKDLEFKYLCFPHVVDSDEKFLLMEYIPRTYYTRDSILEREWTDKDLNLWVNGLLEFQGLKLCRKSFPLKRKLVASVYPVFRISERLRKFQKPLGVAERMVIMRLTLAYLLARPFIRHVLTHYDCQTYNYTFCLNSNKMSILDFEFSYYLGDPLYDILYFITIPTVKIRDWTFQSNLLTCFLSKIQHRKGYCAGLQNRLHLVLLLCNLSRFLHFSKDPVKQVPYWDNLKLLLDQKSWDLFWRKIIVKS